MLKGLSTIDILIRKVSFFPRLIVFMSISIFAIRASLIMLGEYDVEAATAIIPGLQHPWDESWQAPYGVIWYILNIPLTWFQISGINPEQSWLLWLSAIDSVVIWIMRRGRFYTIFYIAISLLTFRQAPYNMTILWITLAGIYWPPSLIIAPLAKFPIGAPPEIWQYIFSNSMQSETNWRYYALMIMLWFVVLYRVRMHFLRWFRHKDVFKSTEISRSTDL